MIAVRHYGKHTHTRLSESPACDLCGDYKPYSAVADCRLPLHGGWAYVCEMHFAQQRCEVGLGKGQRLVCPPSFLQRIDLAECCEAWVNHNRT